MTPLLLFATGIVSGAFASTTGGAGLISLPMLLLTGSPPAVAIATLRPAVLVLEIISVARLKKEKLMTPAVVKEGLFFGIFASFGALAGAVVMLRTPPEHLEGMIAVCLIGMLVLSITNVFHSRFNLHFLSSRSRWMLVTLSAILFGAFAGYFGVAFAVLFLLLMNATTKQPLMLNVAVSKVTGLLLSIAATIFYVRLVPIDLVSMGALAGGLALGGWVGLGVSMKRGETYVRALLFVVVLATLIKFFF